jgi:hypothetical protein
LRRRLDRQERIREALLLDLGAIIFELHRQERREPEVLQAKAAELVAIDDEVRAITEALGEGHGLPQLTASGLVATCTACGGIMGVRDRHCPSCGAAAGAESGDGHERPPLEEPSYEGEEFEVHQAVDAADDGEGLDDAEEAIPEREAVAVSGDAAVGSEGATGREGDVGGNGATPSADATSWPQATREALVPRAQRTLRAGRRLARSWIDERRASGR